MQKGIIWTDRAQRVDEKNGVICPFFMFIPSVKVTKMSKNQSQFGQNFYSLRKCYELLGSQQPLGQCCQP